MRQLVVLVGLPGSGKTALHQKKPHWAIVSKDAIRQTIFRTSYEPEFEDVVDRIFSAALIEAAESSAETVCIDDLNLLRKERRSYIELGQMTGREIIAIVMPHDPIDEIYQRAQVQLEELSTGFPRLRIASLPRERFDAMLRCYEAVLPNEGFTRIERESQLYSAKSGLIPSTAVRMGRRREEKQNPIPLFASS